MPEIVVRDLESGALGREAIAPVLRGSEDQSALCVDPAAGGDPVRVVIDTESPYRVEVFWDPDHRGRIEIGAVRNDQRRLSGSFHGYVALSQKQRVEQSRRLSPSCL